MGRQDDSFSDAIKQRLLATAGKIPTSSLGRYARTAGAALRSGRMLLGRGAEDDEQWDVDQAARLVASIGQLKGITMKMGQIMSYIDVAIPEQLRAALAVLQTHSQPMPPQQVRELVRADLGPRADELLAGLSPQPLAAASIGQVHSSSLPDGTAVAVKVRYPGVDQAIEADFGASPIGTTMTSLFYPGASIKEFIAEAKARFLEECDYEHEAHCQQRFCELYADHPVLTVPRVHEAYCGTSVLTTSLVQGRGFEQYLAADPPQQERDRVGAALFEFYVGTLFLHQLYNCDPHPGNYLFQPDGKVAMLDYGCTREFEPGFVDLLAALTRAVHADEPQRLHRAFMALGMVREGKKYDFDTARGLVRSFYGPMLEDRVQQMNLGQAKDARAIFASKRQLMKLNLPGEFLFLFRIRFGLMSVLARLGARANWYQLERGFLGETRG